MSDVETKRGRSIRRLYVGVGISLLCHVTLFVLVPRPLETGERPPSSEAAKGPLEVRLSPRSAETPPLTPDTATESTATPPKRVPAQSNMMAIPRQTPASPVIPLQETVPAPVSPADAAEPPSMMAMVEAARARRRSSEEALRQQNAEARVGEGSSGDDAAAANLRRNLQSLSGRGGTSGVFQILQKGHRSGQFAFRGWTTGASSDWKQVIEVDAGPQGDLELAMVRKMIELIRQHYKGNFNWDSHRMGRVIVLSARIEDSAGLEAFLMREFFGNTR